jgi:DMSO/TMAO reductase YedYZ molybdopterin-dependent catalytic subunit
MSFVAAGILAWPAPASGNPGWRRLRIGGVTSSPNRRGGVSVGARLGFGVATGLITACVAIGVAQLAAGITGPQSSPVVAVGGAAIDNAPPPVKNFAISAFGSNDKTVLVAGILVVLALFAAAIGVAALRRLGYGLAGLAVFTLIGLAAALTRPGASIVDALPVLVGAAAGAFTMARLVQALPAAGRAEQARAPGAGRLQAGSSATASGPAGTGDAAPAGTSDATAAGTADAVPADSGPPPAPGESWVPTAPPPVAPASPPPRRKFLITSAVALGAAGASALIGQRLGQPSAAVVQARTTLRFPAPARPAPPLPPGVNLGIPGLSSFITPNSEFYRVDTAIVVPEVDPASWHLRIHGMVEREITISFADLLRRPLIEDYITLCCVSNPVAGPYIGNAKWLGASLASLLRSAGIRSGASQLLCTSVDGFTSGTPVQVVMDGRDALVAVAMNGTPLPVAHGFPARLVVPGLYGYVSACKWVTDINVTTFAAAQAYWVPRGWSQQAPIKTESRIDVPNGSATLQAGRTQIAGVAWAQHKGIDAVEVRVDSGPWHQARLAAVPGIDTWRQWVWDWDATPGSHLIEARATDATGYTQTANQAAPEPNGASGYPTVTVSVQ